MKEIYIVQNLLTLGTGGAIFKVNDKVDQLDYIVKLTPNVREWIDYPEITSPALIDSPYCAKYDRVDYVYFNLAKETFDSTDCYHYALRMPLYPYTLRDHITSKSFDVTDDHTKLLIYSMVMGIVDTCNSNIIHGDIKTDNWVLQSPTHAILIDYGHSRNNICASNEKSSDLYTLPYCPPEVLLGGQKLFISDVWALGVTLAEMYLGKMPFNEDVALADKVQEVIKEIEREYRIRYKYLPDVEDDDYKGKANSLGGLAHILGSIVDLWPGSVNMPDYEQYSHLLNISDERGISSLFDNVSKRDILLEDLVIQMLQVNTVSRPNIYQVIQHPYFSNLTKSPGLSCSDRVLLTYRPRMNASELPQIDINVHDLYVHPVMAETIRKLGGDVSVYFLAADYLRRLYSSEIKTIDEYVLPIVCIIMAINTRDILRESSHWSIILEFQGTLDGIHIEHDDRRYPILYPIPEEAVHYETMTDIYYQIQIRDIIRLVMVNCQGRLAHSTVYDYFTAVAQEKRLAESDIDICRAILIFLSYYGGDTVTDPRNIVNSLLWLFTSNDQQSLPESVTIWLTNLINMMDRLEVVPNTKLNSYFVDSSLIYRGDRITSYGQLATLLRAML